MDSAAKQPFLQDSYDSSKAETMESIELYGENAQPQKVPSRPRSVLARLFWRPMVLHAALIIVYSLLFAYFTRKAAHPHMIINSPASEAIRYQQQTFYPRTYDNPFTGDPRPELEEAWHNLLRYSHIRVTHEELEAANYTSISFQDGTGYIAQLASTHQLHCLKQIRRYIHRDVYFPNATVLELTAQGIHVDHCLEVLRLSTMCTGDVSLTPFYFATSKDGSIYPFVKTRTYHQCVDWDRLVEWNKERTVDLFDPDLLQLPPGARLLHDPRPNMVL